MSIVTVPLTRLALMNLTLISVSPLPSTTNRPPSLMSLLPKISTVLPQPPFWTVKTGA